MELTNTRYFLIQDSIQDFWFTINVMHVTKNHHKLEPHTIYVAVTRESSLWRHQQYYWNWEKKGTPVTLKSRFNHRVYAI